MDTRIQREEGVGTVREEIRTMKRETHSCQSTRHDEILARQVGACYFDLCILHGFCTRCAFLIIVQSMALSWIHDRPLIMIHNLYV